MEKWLPTFLSTHFERAESMLLSPSHSTFKTSIFGDVQD